ncbi:MAG: hypothetical protein IKG85_08110 [Clostridia bacterium]|nr:hypothetical protein [Clostridia bacterium]
MAKNSENSNPIGKVRRSIWFVLRAVLIVSVVLGLAYAVFTEAMYVSNMYVVTTEGMKLRADTVLKNGSKTELRQYFTDDFIASDALLADGAYLDYAVDSYDYRYSIKGFSVFPWATTGSFRYVERIPTITATPVSDEVSGPVTPWVPMYYKVNLKKVDGRWLIDSLVVLEENTPEEARPTPDYSQLEDGD